MGGMAAALPIKDDVVANTEAIARVEKDKEREVLAGHDGTWVAHPAFVAMAKSIFDKHMPTPNQITTASCSIGETITEANLLELPSIPHGQAITSVGLKKGISIILCYTEAWLRGVGCIPLYNHMEDAATAEISRAQIWQWRYHEISTQDDNLTIDCDRIKRLIDAEVLERSKNGVADGDGKWVLAGKLVSFSWLFVRALCNLN